MLTSSYLALFLPLFLLVFPVRSQELSFKEGTPSFSALFNPAVGGLEASLSIRFLYIDAIARYEAHAACNETALSFLGKNFKFRGARCSSNDIATLRAVIQAKVLEVQYPVEAKPLLDYLRSLHIVVDDNKNMNSLSGNAMRIAKYLNMYLSNDGWHSQGDPLLPASLRKAYFDTTGFEPANKAEVPPSKLPRPLLWQPLQESSGSTGGFKYQVFNTPQLGSAKPLVITRANIEARTAPDPYQHPDVEGMSIGDQIEIENQVYDFLKTARDLTVRQRFLAKWWENKRISLGSMLPYYEKKLNLSDFEAAYINLSMLMAQHDSLIVAWKEKLRVNAVRPETVVRRMFAGKPIKVFVSESVGVQTIYGQDFKPFISTQAHPEFPSGSALICTTGVDALDTALKDLRGKVPRYTRTFKRHEFGFQNKVPIKVSYDYLRQASEECGVSRLYAGVHFKPSVVEGEILSEGIGKAAYDHVRDLVHGRIPKVCARCT